MRCDHFEKRLWMQLLALSLFCFMCAANIPAQEAMPEGMQSSMPHGQGMAGQGPMPMHMAKQGQEPMPPARPGIMCAHPNCPMMHRNPGPGMMNAQDPLGMLKRPGIQKDLGITDDQRKRLEEIGFNLAKNTIQQRATEQVLRLELNRLMQSDTPDRAAIDKKIQEISQNQAALMRSSTNGRLDAQAVLTKEQREKLKELARKEIVPKMQPMQPMAPMRSGTDRAPAVGPIPRPPIPPKSPIN